MKSGIRHQKAEISKLRGRTGRRGGNSDQLEQSTRQLYSLYRELGEAEQGAGRRAGQAEEQHLASVVACLAPVLAAEGRLTIRPGVPANLQGAEQLAEPVVELEAGLLGSRAPSLSSLSSFASCSLREEGGRPAQRSATFSTVKRAPSPFGKLKAETGRRRVELPRAPRPPLPPGRAPGRGEPRPAPRPSAVPSPALHPRSPYMEDGSIRELRHKLQQLQQSGSTADLTAGQPAYCSVDQQPAQSTAAQPSAVQLRHTSTAQTALAQDAVVVVNQGVSEAKAHQSDSTHSDQDETISTDHQQTQNKGQAEQTVVSALHSVEPQSAASSLSVQSPSPPPPPSLSPEPDPLSIPPCPPLKPRRSSLYSALAPRPHVARSVSFATAEPLLPAVRTNIEQHIQLLNQHQSSVLKFLSQPP